MSAVDASDFRFAQIGELAGRARRALKSALPVLVVLLAGETVYQIISGQPGAIAFGLLSLGTLIALAVWQKKGAGLPLMPMIVIQHLVIYGLPLIVAHTDIATYSRDFVTKAGVELLIFLGTLTAAWRMGLGLFRPSPPVSYALSELNRSGGKKLGQLGFFLIVTTFLYQVLQRLGALDDLLAMLPAGSFSILWALLSAAGTCGFFILSMLMGHRQLSTTQRVIFWLILAGNGYIAASSFLLSSAAIMVISVAIGLFWSTGRVPWIYVIIIALVFSFLNIGKVTMRERYWGTAGADNIPDFSLGEMPDRYTEWVGASFDALTGSATESSSSWTDRPQAAQSLLERINNLQNLLYVIDAVEVHHIDVLEGATYTLIPKLLIPKILWPQKPGTHEGQAMLNIHFGRQDLLSTTTTYVAWGLLPEAYGNFGPIWGALFLGCFLGLIFAWVERFTEDKLVVSMEGFVAFTVFLAMANSFEFVASVLVTSIEQSIIPIVVATAPIARRTAVQRAKPGER